MDWDTAFTGVCHGIEPRKPQPKQCGQMFNQILALRDEQMSNSITDGGGFCEFTLKELEPTYDNEWDYLWPLDV